MAKITVELNDYQLDMLMTLLEEKYFLNGNYYDWQQILDAFKHRER